MDLISWLYAAALTLLALFGFNMVFLAVLALVSGRWRPAAWTRLPLPANPADWPSVLVQLPLFNERYVAEKLIDAVAAKEGKVRLLAQFENFAGWDLHALWDDIKFATTHCTKIERIALVGDKWWEQWMANVCKPFTMAKIQYFDIAEAEAARAWVIEASPQDS